MQGIYLLLIIFSPFIGYLLEYFYDLDVSIAIAGATFLLLASYFVKGIRFKNFITLILILLLYYIISAILSAYFYGGTLFYFRDIYRNNFLLFALLLIALSSNTLSAGEYQNVYTGMYVLFFISVVVIIIQQFANPLFFTSKDWYVRDLTSYQFNIIKDRLPSIYSFSGSQSAGIAFNAIYALLLEKSLKNNKRYLTIALFILALLYAIFQKSRWVLIYYFIVSLQIPIRTKFKFRRAVLYIIIFILFIQTLIWAGVPLADIVNYRYLDKDVGGITHGSYQARESSFRVFQQFVNVNPLWGVQGEGNLSDFSRELGRSRPRLLIGILDPLLLEGIVGSLWLYLFIAMLLRQLYLYGRHTRNYAYFLIFIGFLVTNLSINYMNFMDMGIIIMIVLYNNERYKLSLEKELYAK
jgi:hypothetical protein